jgi:hypothetical protein
MIRAINLILPESGERQRGYEGRMNDDEPPSGDGMVPEEDDSLLRQPADEVVDDSDTADDPEADQRAEPETPAHEDREEE